MGQIRIWVPVFPFGTFFCRTTSSILAGSSSRILPKYLRASTSGLTPPCRLSESRSRVPYRVTQTRVRPWPVFCAWSESSDSFRGAGSGWGSGSPAAITPCSWRKDFEARGKRALRSMRRKGVEKLSNVVILILLDPPVHADPALKPRGEEVPVIAGFSVSD